MARSFDEPSDLERGDQELPSRLLAQRAVTAIDTANLAGRCC